MWPLVESDRRVQLMFTRPPGALVARGTDQFLARLGGVVVPWQQALHAEFDLAIAASHGGLERLHAPVLTIPHGIGFSKFNIRYAGPGPEASLDVAGLERAALVSHGRVIPSAIVVPTSRDLRRLTEALPEAAPAAVVGGDPCYDRLAASLPMRHAYRRALGAWDRKLIAVSSTWGAGSLLERRPDILSQLARELPSREYCLAAIVHPNAWFWHGSRQVRAWCAAAMRSGLVMVPPEEGWRAVLAAADCLIGDHGSVTAYGAASGVPVLLGTRPTEHIVPESPVAHLTEMAPLLDAGPLVPQLTSAMAGWSAESQYVMRGMLTDVPGQSARIIRKVMYQLMSLQEPDGCPEAPPVPEPMMIPSDRAL